jgi:hypothetical protein
MNKTQISGVVEEVKELKRGVKNNNEWVFLKVKISGKEYVSFDKKFLEAEGYEGNFLTWKQLKDGKESELVELPEVNTKPQERPKNKVLHDLDQAVILIGESARGIERTVEIMKDIMKELDA